VLEKEKKNVWFPERKPSFGRKLRTDVTMITQDLAGSEEGLICLS